ncbi:MAG TPA: M14 family metallopeptidase [Bacteroidales bacterium]|nr:M14 family metallopeptidase [Bacteroidales bacterium]
MKKILFCIIISFAAVSLKAQEEDLFFRAAGSPANPKVEVSWNRYNTNKGIADICSKLVKAYPDLISLESIGKSYQGRDILLLTVTDRKAGKPENKPGFWIDGNIHSVEIQGTEMALYTAWYLCEMHSQNEFIKELLRDKVFYIAPTINPDAREYFAFIGIPPRSGLVPRDNDRDGLFDEDGYDDLNNDGNITQMRRKNPEGMFIEDPADRRRLIRAAQGEKGEYELLGYEGIDNDGDGLINEDGPGGYDGNRDWGFNWEPNYVQNGADKYPFTFPENQAIRNFVLNHRNINGSQSFHNSGGMILKGPSIKGGGAEAYSRADEEAIESIGKKGELMIPGYKLLTIWKDMYTVYGGELDWWYGAVGCFAFSNELWTPYLMFNDTSHVDQYEFDRLLLFEDAFIPWQKISHPVYGEIETGGFNKNFGRMHPGFLLESDAHRNAAFCIYNAYQSPKLEITRINVKKLDGGLQEVTARIGNARMLPTHSATNIKYHIDPPDYISLEGGTVIAGMISRNEDLDINDEQKKNPSIIEVPNIPGYSAVVVKWIVKGGKQFTVKVKSTKGGTAIKTSE